MSAIAPNQGFVDLERIEHDSPFRSLGQHPNGGPMDLEGWPAMQTEVCYLILILSFVLSLVETVHGKWILIVRPSCSKLDVTVANLSFPLSLL